MKKALLIEKSDIKKILAEYYHVEEKDIKVMQYSFLVTMDEKESN